MYARSAEKDAQTTAATTAGGDVSSMCDWDFWFDFLIGFVIGMFFIGVILTSLIFIPKINELGNAICEDTFGEGSEYSHMEGNDVICEEPKDSEEFDGLRVRLE